MNRTAFITEGAFKALVLEKKYNCLICALPGVNNWKLALPFIAQHSLKKVVLAFGSDMVRTKEVASATYELAQLLILEGIDVEMATWSTQYKGIDDAISSKEKIILIKNNELQVYLKALKEKFAPDSDNWNETESDFTSWPKLEDEIFRKEKSLPSIPPDAVPEPLNAFASDIAERTQVPWEYVLSFLIVALSSLIGAKIKIRPKQFDPWTVVVNLWGGLVAEASTLKSPAFAPILKLIKRLDSKFQEEYRLATIRWVPQRKILTARLKQVEKAVDEALRENEFADLSRFEEQIRTIESELVAGEPVQRRLYTNDATIEKIGELLTQNKNGLLVLRDEILGLLNSMEKAGREGERQFYLEGWAGDTSYQVDRIGRGSIFIAVLLLSVFGAIQPEPLFAYLGRLKEAGLLHDGFIQRLQLLFMPKIKKDWQNVDRYPDKVAEENIYNVFSKIVSLELPKSESGEPLPIILHFDREAQEFFNSWLECLEIKLRSGDLPSKALASHLGKYRSLLPSLATIFFVCEQIYRGKDITANEAVSLSNIKMAANWCEVLSAHAECLYEVSSEGPSAEAINLYSKIVEGKVQHQDRLRDIANKNWKGFPNAATLKVVAEELERYGLLRLVEERKGRGHPSVRIYLHPSLKAGRALEK